MNQEKITNLIKSINYLIDLGTKDFSVSIYELQLQLVNIYHIYLQLADSTSKAVNSDGSIDISTILVQLDKNFKGIVKKDSRMSFGGVTLIPVDDLADVILSLEHSLYVYKNVNETAFIEEFNYQIRKQIQPLMNCIIYFSQFSETHK